ncbi:M55 family metallopeptidase [Cloacibacillus evryensis]|uniref:M55 family metallopeptidase n=1 Tax=Cloacibacillus evryensis TaxID=508460 RepID=UPI0004B89D87|nr:M55 family metallopeptidase [Cloacibacillus evryensis]MCQ4762860.1 M55 family metallopeptidase [Cloacibacillus evryensis]
MKIYISSDMEGSTGVVSAAQVDCTKPQYAFGRAMQAADVAAAVKAAIDSGAECVVVNDSHCTMTNLDIAGFGGEVRLITGAPKLLGMVEGARGCDAAIFLGYHAMAGTEKAVLDHTFDQHTIYGLAINGRKMGETGVNALLCGALGVPVIMVSGDDALCLEAGSLLGRQLETCSVKEGLGRAAALCLTPESSAELIRSGVKRAVERLKKGEFAPFTPAAPYLLEVTLMNTLQTDAASLVPGAVRTAARTLRFETEDALELRRFLYSLMECAAATLSSY